MESVISSSRYCLFLTLFHNGCKQIVSLIDAVMLCTFFLVGGVLFDICQEAAGSTHRSVTCAGLCALDFIVLFCVCFLFLCDASVLVGVVFGAKCKACILCTYQYMCYMQAQLEMLRSFFAPQNHEGLHANMR